MLATMLLCVALVFFSLFYTCKNQNEYFETLLSPVQNKDRVIRPYEDCSDNIKKSVVDAFQKEWGTGTITYDDEIISRLWKQPGGALFVMTDKTGIFIGTSGIDRNYHYPFVSHLFVMKDFRNKGCGTALLKATESYGSSVLKSDTVSLWCKDECVDFYRKRGWSIHGVSRFSNAVLGNTLMTKQLNYKK